MTAKGAYYLKGIHEGYPPTGTGVQHMRRKQQPYTVWFGGGVAGWCNTEEKAKAALRLLLNGEDVDFSEL